MILFLFLLNVFGIALLTGKMFNRQVGLWAGFLFLASFWSKSVISSGETKIFFISLFLTYGLWLVLKFQPKFTFPFLILISILAFLILYPDFNFWLKHGFYSNPIFVPTIHEYINECHRVFPIPVCRLIYNKPAFFIRQYFVNFLSHFSPDSLFTADKENLLFAPFFYLGLFSILFSWRKNLLLITWIFLYPLTASFLGGFDYFYSALGLSLLPIISALGVSQTIKFIKNRQ